ncbi:helix-turn-helix domain-containing protein [Leuconostoc mesenteroides]|uniref:helix-turn-helix domain-containing protein n=1 Tax=Leuconostoc mesenteroides TaxID=1245 RepID=UPI00077563FB|nr:helix-turn-helix transcriptional regulator [Leuconostoc mesenteroides]MCM6831250.1 helix-turn-helix domain-containing protein [Leuconostoc mesenteroides]
MNRLKELRLENNLTVEELAKEVFNSRANISRYERGLTEPKLATWELLADYFDVDPEYLVGWSDIKRKNAQ